MVEVVGVKFAHTSKIYFFDPNGIECELGSSVIVNTARGMEYAIINQEKRLVDELTIVAPLKPILRIANEQDEKNFQKNEQDAQKALEICIQKASEHNLVMNLIQAEYTFDRAKLIFYFTADGRIDFRELVRDLAAIFHTRIELRQVGVRDKARHLGGIGMCGKPYCCKKWMHDFQTVTIKMAKDQGLTLNPTKISGACGRLFCCLKFEQEQYEGILKIMPPVGSIVKTPDGTGKVVQTQMVLKEVKVLFDSEENIVFKTYPAETVQLIKKKHQQDVNKEQEASFEELKSLED